MKDTADVNFGVVIAFLLPGFLLLWALSYSSYQVQSWLAASSAKEGHSIGGFLYSTLASLALGLLISAVRQLVVDEAHYHTGVEKLNASFAKLNDEATFAAFQGAVENHYRYYQYYGNTLVAVFVGFIVRLYYGAEHPPWTLWLAAIGIAIVLFFASRRELSAFTKRAKEILS